MATLLRRGGRALDHLAQQRGLAPLLLQRAAATDAAAARGLTRAGPLLLQRVAGADAAAAAAAARDLTRGGPVLLQRAAAADAAAARGLNRGGRACAELLRPIGHRCSILRRPSAGIASATGTRRQMTTYSKWQQERHTCSLPRLTYGVKGLKDKYMRVPSYEEYGSEFSMLYLLDQMTSIDKLMKGYQRSWSLPAGMCLIVIICASCVLMGYNNHKRNEKTLTEIRNNVNKAAGIVTETKDILEELEKQIAREEGK